MPAGKACFIFGLLANTDCVCGTPLSGCVLTKGRKYRGHNNCLDSLLVAMLLIPADWPFTVVNSSQLTVAI